MNIYKSNKHFIDVLSTDDLKYILSLPEVKNAKLNINNTNKNMIYFNIKLTPSIKSSIKQKLGLDLNKYSSIPMRWIKGDTPPHTDKGEHDFKNTYLIYLNDSVGELVIGETSYPIQSNNGFVFQEGIFHKTTNTGNQPRLMMGPMNELAEPVGLHGAGAAYMPIFLGGGAICLYTLYRVLPQLYNAYLTAPKETSNTLKKIILVTTILTIIIFQYRFRKCDGINAYISANNNLVYYQGVDADAEQMNKEDIDTIIIKAKKTVQELSQFKGYDEHPGYCNYYISNNIYTNGILVFTIIFVLSSIILKQYNTKWVVIAYILLFLINNMMNLPKALLSSIQSVFV